MVKPCMPALAAEYWSDQTALLAVDRTDVDNVAPATLNHVVNDLFGHVEQAVEVASITASQSALVICGTCRHG